MSDFVDKMLYRCQTVLSSAAVGDVRIRQHGHESLDTYHDETGAGAIWPIPKLPWPSNSKKAVLKAAEAVRKANRKLATFEQGFISESGIKDREWYRHLGVAPGKWLGKFACLAGTRPRS